MTDPSNFHLVVDITATDDAFVDLLETWARLRLPVGVSHPTSSGWGGLRGDEPGT